MSYPQPHPSTGLSVLAAAVGLALIVHAFRVPLSCAVYATAMVLRDWARGLARRLGAR